MGDPIHTHTHHQSTRKGREGGREGAHLPDGLAAELVVREFLDPVLGKLLWVWACWASAGELSLLGKIKSLLYSESKHRADPAIWSQGLALLTFLEAV